MTTRQTLPSPKSEGFTVHINTRFKEILRALMIEPDVAKAERDLEVLFTEIGFRSERVHDQALERMRSILAGYRQAIEAANEKLGEDLFRLVAQLEYPSRQ